MTKKMQMLKMRLHLPWGPAGREETSRPEELEAALDVFGTDRIADRQLTAQLAVPAQRLGLRVACCVLRVAG